MSSLLHRALSIAVTGTLAAASLVALSLVAAPTPASATHLPGPSVDCYYGSFDGWLANNDVGATDDVYDRDVDGTRLSTPPLYNSFNLSVFGSSAGVLANDFTLKGFTGEQIPVTSLNQRAVLWAGPDHAQSFTLNADGTFTYIPVSGYFGADSFQYVYAGKAVGSPCSNVATVHITAAERIRAQEDVYTAYQDTALEVGKIVCGFTCGLLDNDVLADRDSVVKTIATRLPAVFTETDVTSIGTFATDQGGTLSYVNPNGSFIYTPPPGFTGDDFFVYRAQGTSQIGLQLSMGAEGGTHTRVTIHVVDPPAPDVPVGAADLISVVEDTPKAIPPGDLLQNDPNGSYVTYIGGAQFDGQTEVRTQHGKLDIFWSGYIPDIPLNLIARSITYTPDADYFGVDRFTYYVTNNPIDGLTTPVEVFLDVAPVTDAPHPVNDALTIDEDVPTEIDVAANDTDGDGDLVRASVIKDPCDGAHLCAPVGSDLYLHGDWAVNGDGTVIYTPEQDYVGEAIFLYRISDALGNDGFARVTVTVQPSDAMDDSYATAEDELLDVGAPGVLGNDDPSAASDEPVIVTAPEHGNAVLAADGSFTYLPDKDFAGTDSFTYEAGGDTGVATIDVAAVDDDPVVALNGFCDPSTPVACVGDLDTRNIVEGQTAQLRGSITDPESDGGSFVIDWGDGSQTEGVYPCSGEDCPFVYLPTVSSPFCLPIETCAGPLFFTFEHLYADDPAGSADHFPITMTAAQSGGPSGVDSERARVLNSAPTVTIAPACEAGAGEVCLGDYSILKGAPGDQLRVGGKVSDLGLDDGTLTIDWGDGSDDTVVPTGCDDSVSTCPTPSQQSSGCQFSFLAPPACGYFAGTHAYAAGGEYTITVAMDDGDGGTVEETTTATVAYVNEAPDAADAGVATPEDTATEVDLAELVSDLATADADLEFSLVDNPAIGTAELDGSVVTYTPSPDANGVDAFAYRVTDRGDPDGCGEVGPDCSGPLEATATVTVTVDAVNDAPSFVAGEDLDAVGDGVAVTVPGWATAISAGPADEAGQTVGFVVDTDDSALFADDGQPAVAADGTLSFVPVAAGVAQLNVTATDSGGGDAPNDDSSAPQTFTIVIAPPNLAPVLTVPANPTGTYSDDLSFVVSASDPEDGVAGVAIEVGSLPAGLSLTGTAAQKTISGTLTAEPGTYPVVVRACDAFAACAETTASIVVQPEAASVEIAASTPAVVAAGADGLAPSIRISAKLTEDSDRRWADLGLVAPDDMRVRLTSVATGYEATCAPQIVKTKAGRGNAAGTIEIDCDFAAGVPVGVYDVEVAIGRWFTGTAHTVLTVSAPATASEPEQGTGSVALTGGGTGEFSFSITASGAKSVTGTWSYLERGADGSVVHSVVSSSITSFAVTGSGDARTIEIVGKADVDGVGGHAFRVTAIDRADGSDVYGQEITRKKRTVPPTLTFDPVPLTGGDVSLH